MNDAERQLECIDLQVCVFCLFFVKLFTRAWSFPVSSLYKHGNTWTRYLSWKLRGKIWPDRNVNWRITLRISETVLHYSWHWDFLINIKYAYSSDATQKMKFFRKGEKRFTTQKQIIFIKNRSWINSKPLCRRSKVIYFCMRLPKDF